LGRAHLHAPMRSACKIEYMPCAHRVCLPSAGADFACRDPKCCPQGMHQGLSRAEAEAAVRAADDAARTQSRSSVPVTQEPASTSAAGAGAVPAGQDIASASAADGAVQQSIHRSSVPATQEPASTLAPGGAVAVKQEPGSASAAGQPAPYWEQMREAEYSEEELGRWGSAGAHRSSSSLGAWHLLVAGMPTFSGKKTRG
jgi:hypothetical protein